MNRYKKLCSLGVVLLSMLGLAACSNSSAPNKPVHLSAQYNASKPATKSADKGTLKVANVSDSPFEGITAPTLDADGSDMNAYAPGGDGALFKTDKYYRVVKGGLANLKLNKKANTATITLRKNAHWSNGMKVTAKDVEYPYEIIANKNTKSQQYNDDMTDIKGMAAYHAGKAKNISGITMPDGPKGRVAVIHYNHLTPAVKYSGSDVLWNSVEPYEYLKNVPIPKLESSNQVRRHPIFVGPYKLKKQVDGESTDWVPNKYYYGPRPKIKHVHVQVVSTSNFTEALKSKKYDFTLGAPSAQYPHIKALKDYTVTGRPNLGYTYFGFNVGHATKNDTSVQDKNKKMDNENLRRAMMYALNLNEVAKKFGYGLNYRANSLIPPIYGKYHASYKSVPGFPYNMAKARKLLRNAGYKKRNGSKWVSQPNGKKLVVHFGCAQGDAANNAEDHYYVQQWRKLGLDTKFTNGRPMEQNSFYAELDKPRQNSIDVFESGFTLNTEPTPTAAFGNNAAMNMGHLNYPKLNKLMKEMNNKKSFNLKYRLKVFKKWQKLMNKYAAATPEYFGLTWTPVNHRVTGYNASPANGDFWGKLGLNSSNLK